MSAINETTAAVEVSPIGQATPVPGDQAAQPGRRRSSTWLTRPLANRKAAVGGIILVVFAFVGLFAPVLAPYDPTEFVGRPHRGPSSEFKLGTTGSGQDMLSQIIYGTRISLGAGMIVGVATTVIGGLVGLAAGYFRGRIDDILSLLTNVMLIIPGLPLLVVLAAFLPPGFWTTVMVLTIAGWAWPARVLRSQTLSLREKDFVSSALVSGEGSWRIMLREILPNMMSIVVAGMFGAIIYAIGAQAALEFLGLGNPSAISWGTILYWAGNNAGLLVGAWWTFVPAGLCIALVAFAFALVNYAIDEVTNPRLRSQRETNLALRRHRRRLGSSRATPVLIQQAAGD